MNNDRLLARTIVETIKRERRNINKQIAEAIAASSSNKSQPTYTKIIGWR